MRNKESGADEVTAEPSDVRRSFKAVPIVVHPELLKGHQQQQQQQAPSLTVHMEYFGIQRAGEHMNSAKTSSSSRNVGAVNEITHGAMDKALTASTCVSVGGNKPPVSDAHPPASILSLESFKAAVRNVSKLLTSLIGSSDGGLLEDGEDHPSDAVVAKRRLAITRYLHSMSDFTSTGFVSLLRPHELLTLSKMLGHVESLALEASAAIVSSDSKHGEGKRSGAEGEDNDTDTLGRETSGVVEEGDLSLTSARKQKGMDGAVVPSDNAPDSLSCARLDSLFKRGGAARVVARLFEVNTSLIRLSEPIDQTTAPSKASSTAGVSSVTSAGHLAAHRQTLRLRQELSTLAKCILLASEVTNASTAERLGNVVQEKLLPKLSLTLAALGPHDGSLVDVISLRSIVELFWSIVPAISTIVTCHPSATSSQASSPATLLHAQASASDPSASFPATTVDHTSSSSFAPAGGGHNNTNRVSALALKSAHFVKLKSSVSIVEAMSARATQLTALLNEQKARLTGLLERIKTASELKTSNNAGGSGAGAIVDASPTDDNADDNAKRAQLEATDVTLIEEEVQAARATLAVISSEIKAARTAVVNEATAAINSFWKNAAEAGERAALHAYSLLVCPQSYEPFLSGTDSAAAAVTSPLGYLLPDSFVTLLATFVESFYDSPHSSSFICPLPTSSTSSVGEGSQLGAECGRSQIGSFVLIEGRRLFNLVVSAGSDDAMDLTGRSSFGGGLSSPTGGGTGSHGEEAWRDALAVVDPRPYGSTTIAKNTSESSPSACKRECGSPSRNRGHVDQSAEGGVSPAVAASRAETVLKPYRYAASGASSPWAEAVGSPNRNNDILAQIAARRRRQSSLPRSNDLISKTYCHLEPIANANSTGGEKGQLPEPTNTNNTSTISNTTTNSNEDMDNSNDPFANSTSTCIAPPAIGAKRERGELPQSEPRGASSSLSTVCGGGERTPTSKPSASILPMPSPHDMLARGSVNEQGSHSIGVNGGESTSKRIRFEEDRRGCGGVTPTARCSQQLPLSSASPDSHPHHDERPEEKRSLPSNTSSASAGLTSSGSSVPSFLLGPTTNTASVFSRSGNRPVSVSIVASDGTTTRLSAAAIAEADAAGTTVSLASTNALSLTASNTNDSGGPLLPPPSVSSSASLIPIPNYPFGHGPDHYSTDAGGHRAGAGMGILGRASSHMLDGVPLSATASIGMGAGAPLSRPGRDRVGGGDAILSLDGIIGLGIGAGDGGGRYSLPSSDGLFAPFGMSSSSDALAGQRGGLGLGLGAVVGISRGILSPSTADGAEREGAGGWSSSTPPSSFGMSVARAKQVLLELMLGTKQPRLPNDDKENQSAHNCGVPDALRILLNHLYFSKGGGETRSSSRSCPLSLMPIVSTCMCSCCGQLPLISPLSYSTNPQYGRTVLGAIMPRPRGAMVQASAIANPSAIMTNGDLVLGGSAACGEGILSKPSLLAAPTTSQGVLQGVGILGDGGHLASSSPIGVSASNASSSSSEALALLVSVAELVSQTHLARDGGGRRSVGRGGGGGGHIPAMNMRSSNTCGMGVHANSDVLANRVLSYHLNVLSTHFPLRFTCCGSLQCPSCCDLNVCVVCGEEDLIPLEARVAILRVVAEAATTGASSTAARWLSEEATKARGAPQSSSSTTGRLLHQNLDDRSSPSKKAATATPTPTAPFIIPPLITLAEISVELDVLQGGLAKAGKGPIMMSRGHHRPSMSPCVSPALRGVSTSNPASFARSESHASAGSLGGTARDRSGGSATASPSLLSVAAPSQTTHSLSCADLSRASCAPHPSNCPQQQPFRSDLVCLLLGSGEGGGKLRGGDQRSQARSDESASGDDEKSVRGDRDEGLYQGSGTAPRVRAGQLCQSVDGGLQRSKMVYIARELLSELN